MNLFDDIQRSAQSVITEAFGYVAVWQPSKGGGPYSARVLLAQPTRKENVNDEDYTALRPKVEYFENDLPGLLESVNANNIESVTINGDIYIGYTGERKYDGKTIIIYLDKQP